MPEDTHIFKWRKPNAGFIMLKVSESKRIVDEWIRASREEGRHLADKHPRNQGYIGPMCSPSFTIAKNLFQGSIVPSIIGFTVPWAMVGLLFILRNLI